MTYPRAVFRVAFSLIFDTLPEPNGYTITAHGYLIKTRGTFAPLAKKGRVKMNFLQLNFSLLSKTSQS